MKARQNYSISPLEPQNFELVNTFTPEANHEGGLNLKEIVEVIQRRFWLVASITATVTLLAALKPLTSKPEFRSSFEIFVEPVTIETKVASRESKNSNTEEEIVSVKLDEVQLKILKSQQLLESLVKQLKAKYPDLSYDSLIEDLLVSTNKDENLLTVMYRHHNQQQVKDTIGALAQTYMKYSLETRQTGVNRGIKFLDEQIPLIQQQVYKLQEQLQQIRQKNNFIDPRVKAEQLSVRLDNLIKQQQDIQTQIADSELFAAELKRELVNKPDESDTASQMATPFYKELKEQLAKIDIKISQQSVQFSAQSNEMISLKEEREKLIKLIALESKKAESVIAKRIVNLNKQNQFITNKIDNLKQEIQDLSVITRKFDNIVREIEVVSGNVNRFVLEKEGLRVYAAQRKSPWSLLAPPEKPKKHLPSLLKYSLLGTSLGFLVGLGVAIALDKYKDIFNNSQEIRDLTKFPIIGKIPFNKKYKNLPSTGKRIALLRSSSKEEHPLQSIDVSAEILPLLEEFNSLYANLGFLNEELSIRSLAIGSATSGEGKSTIAINLARAVASVGLKVLLVDADLRGSNKICNQLVSNSALGLSDYLCLDTLNFQSVIQRSLVDDNLFVMPSGWMTNNPIRLISSEKMKNLMNQLHKNFDLVIYDTSSLLGYADVNLLASQTDGMVLVTALGKLRKAQLQEALEQLSISRIPVFGVVANHVS
jgi:capsular exopolysaccharide synthesis family protein